MKGNVRVVIDAISHLAGFDDCESTPVRRRVVALLNQGKVPPRIARQLKLARKNALAFVLMRPPAKICPVLVSVCGVYFEGN